MTALGTIVERLGLRVVAGAEHLEREARTGYATDLLSCALGRARAGCLLVTMQAHLNVVAVATMLDLAGVIIAEDRAPDEETIARAREEGVVLLRSPRTTYGVVAGLAALGIPEEADGAGDRSPAQFEAGNE